MLRSHTPPQTPVECANHLRGRCCVDRMPAGSAVAVLRLDGAREFSESCGKPVSRIDIHAEFVVASTEVLDEGVSRADYSC